MNNTHIKNKEIKSILMRTNIETYSRSILITEEC